MNVMSPSRASDIWIDQLFSAQSARSGGVVRRKIADVERNVGRARLELEERRRGFHLIECGGQLVVVCSRADIRLIC